MPTLSRHSKAIAARALEAHTTVGAPDGPVGRLSVSSHAISVLYSAYPRVTFLGSML